MPATDSDVNDDWSTLPRVCAATGMPSFNGVTAGNAHLLNAGRGEGLNDLDPRGMAFNDAEVLHSDPETYNQRRLAVWCAS